MAITLSVDAASALLHEMVTLVRVKPRPECSCAAVLTVSVNLPEDQDVELLASYREHSGARSTRLGFDDIMIDDWADMTATEHSNIRVDRLTAWMNDTFIHPTPTIEQIQLCDTE